MVVRFCVICAVLMFECLLTPEAFLVVPEDVGTAFATIYGFTPRLIIGRDHRFGFGFRFGNHADFQVVYELGPQTTTKALQSNTKVRSAVYQQRARRRPFVELLVRAGLLVEARAQSHAGPGRRDCDTPPDVDYEPR